MSKKNWVVTVVLSSCLSFIAIVSGLYLFFHRLSLVNTQKQKVDDQLKNYKAEINTFSKLSFDKIYHNINNS